MLSLVNDLKESAQDFEFYPTTQEIIDRMLADFESLRYSHSYGYDRIDSVLDIGAGHGKVLRAFRDKANFSGLYTIEKSTILCDRLDNDVFIVGTDFHEQSLVAKQVGLTFCNPPYSEFEEWATKIIRESSSRLVYLVIPQRWEASLSIKNAVEFRAAKTKVIGSFDFLESEDRAARAKVHLIRVELHQEKDDAFDRFFKEQFADLIARFKADKTEAVEPGERTKVRRNPKMDALVVGAAYPERLVELYNAELENIRKNYDAVKGLDVDLLKEFGVDPARILGCLKARLEGLRNTYWQELFSHMSSVTNRLTNKKRQAMLNTLNRSGAVDFTLSNIHAVILWALKNANAYINEQILETFDSMVTKANVRNYKSNQRVFVYDRWRYNAEESKPSHIALEYRIVVEHSGGMHRKWGGDAELDENAAAFLGDLLTVAHCLGFNCKTGDLRLTYHGRSSWAVGSREVFWFTSDGKEEVLFDVRAWLNRNLHIRLNQRFALALNVEVGRLRGWVKSGAEAATELGDITAAQYFGATVKLGTGSLPMLAA